MGVSHVTPILSVVTDNANLYGSGGIFDNWQQDWTRPAYVEYFDTAQYLIFLEMLECKLMVALEEVVHMLNILFV